MGNKNCYRASNYTASKICILAVLILLLLTWYSGLGEQHILYTIPVSGICIFILVVGIIVTMRTRQFRRHCDQIRENGQVCQGHVVDVHVRKAMSDEARPDSYSFRVSYYSPSEQTEKVFWTPVVTFTPFATENITCTVYEYAGEPFAEDFQGWEKNGKTDVKAEILSWLPIIVIFAILIFLFIKMN